MLKSILNNLVLPLVGRAGTAVATVLVGVGVQAEPAQQIGLGIGAALAVGIDLLSDWWGRREVANRTFNATVSTMLEGEVRR